MDSHELAELMQSDSRFLLSKAAFEVHGEYFTLSFGTLKAEFIAAVRALVPGKKEFFMDYTVIFKPSGLKLLQINVDKSAVCRKVQDVKYECEPLLSEEEDAVMEQRA